ncbi:cation channel sperm-associated protein 1 isoform X7 [Oncorhynchus tshawytscha]|uniref:cation channel sperm-associated protein 1 isoform X7 n=1 Tax=Oncorhynchus tshawytscha TaxID=74940 RepID=UPI001C3DD610|nr:cation channel sperm-associated protein 1 isoform X7 [Oncorhynchus tshawytscha]
MLCFVSLLLCQIKVLPLRIMVFSICLRCVVPARSFFSLFSDGFLSLWGSTSHHKSSVAAKQPHKKRVFSTCAALDGEMLKRLIQKDEQRRIREQRNSRKGWLRAWGALQDWMHQLFRIIVAFTEDPMFDKFILFVVVLNTGTLVAQTFESVTVRGGWFFSALDSAFLAIYLMECVLKLLVWGRLYFKNPWNDLDFFIITMSLIDFLLPLIESTGNFSGGQASTIFRILKLFKGVRAIRAFRVLRTIRFLQNLQSIVSTCLQSLQSMGAIIILMFTFLFMFAVIFREMFNESDPHRFGTMFRTIFTLFQLLTLDDWAFIYSTSRDNGERGNTTSIHCCPRRQLPDDNQETDGVKDPKVPGYI